MTRALRTPAFALLACLAGGCSGTETKPDAGGPVGPATEDYFGLQKGRCFEYTTSDLEQSSPDLGVVVEDVDTKQFAVPTRVVAYTVSGMVSMRDYVAVDGDAVVLYKREFPGGKSYIYSPPMKRLAKPVLASSKQEYSTTVTIRDGMGKVIVQDEKHDLRVDVFEANSLHLPIGKDVTASKIAFTETPSVGRSEYRTFLPGDGTRTAADGFVKIDFNFDIVESTPNLVYKLQKVRDLGDSPKTAKPLCGMPP